MVPYGFNLPPISNRPISKFETVAACIDGTILLAVVAGVIVSVFK